MEPFLALPLHRLESQRSHSAILPPPVAATKSAVKPGPSASGSAQNRATRHGCSLHTRQMYGKAKGLQPFLHSGERGAAGEGASEGTPRISRAHRVVSTGGCLQLLEVYLLNYKQTYGA